MKSVMNKLLPVAALLAFSAGANAALLSFDDNGAPSGSVSYDGDGGALVGTNINIASILGTGTAANSGSKLTCDDCVLSFTTGANTAEGPAVWEFAGGGTISITGTAKDSGGVTQASGTLVEGTFSSAFAIGGGTNITVNGWGTDTKNADLLDYYKISGMDFSFATTEISLGGAIIDSDGGFTASVTSVNFDNTEVPLPAAAWLFGSALVGFGAIKRKRKG